MRAARKPAHRPIDQPGRTAPGRTVPGHGSTRIRSQSRARNLIETCAALRAMAAAARLLAVRAPIDRAMRIAAIATNLPIRAVAAAYGHGR